MKREISTISRFSFPSGVSEMEHFFFCAVKFSTVEWKRSNMMQWQRDEVMLSFFFFGAKSFPALPRLYIKCRAAQILHNNHYHVSCHYIVDQTSLCHLKCLHPVKCVLLAHFWPFTGVCLQHPVINGATQATVSFIGIVYKKVKFLQTLMKILDLNIEQNNHCKSQAFYIIIQLSLHKYWLLFYVLKLINVKASLE